MISNVTLQKEIGFDNEKSKKVGKYNSVSVLLVSAIGTSVLAADVPENPDAATPAYSCIWMVTSSGVHLRIGPGTQYRDVVAGVYLQGEDRVFPITIDYDDEGNEWRNCEVTSGDLDDHAGWIRSAYVRCL